MHNISTECLFSFITNPPGGYPPEIRRKSTGSDSGKRPESFKFWCLELLEDEKDLFFSRKFNESVSN